MEKHVPKFAFWGKLLGKPNGRELQEEVFGMRNKNYKGRCEKRTSPKSRDICRIYDKLQKVYLDILEKRKDIAEIRCNVWLEGLVMGNYTSDFVCIKENGELLVRECVFRKYLMKPKTVKLLDASRTYWERRGIQDWGLVIDEE